MDVSFLIVALGDYDRQVNNIINQNLDFSYEILVCSDKLINFENLSNFRFFKDQGTSVSSFNYLYKKSKGKFIICLNNVILPPNNIGTLVNKMKSSLKKGNDFIITSPVDRSAPLAYCEVPEWVAKKINLSHYDARPRIIRWPCFYRQTVEKYLGGVIFNQSFKHHWVDNWLGTFCYVIGKPLKEDIDVKITALPHNSITKHDDHDKKVYELLCDSVREKLNYNLNVKIGE